MSRYKTIGDKLNLKFGDDINDNFATTDSELTRIEKDSVGRVDDHKNSTTAHEAKHITYSGNVPEDNVQAAIDNTEGRLDNILQNNSDTKDSELVDIRTVETGYTPTRTINVAGDVTRELQSRFSSNDTATTTLTEPVNVLSTDYYPSSLKPEFQGDELVNLFGRFGNFETLDLISGVTNASYAQSSNSRYGSNALQVTIGTGNTSGYASADIHQYLESNNYYVVVVDAKNIDTTDVQMYIYSIGGQKKALSSYGLLYFTLTPTEVDDIITNSRSLAFRVYGSEGNKGVFDGARLYKIDSTTHNNIDTMTTEEIERQFPYVDDIKPISNVWMKSVGKQLLPPFTEWNLHDSFSVTSSYRIDGTVSGGNEMAQIYVEAVENQDYYVKVTTNASRVFIGYIDSNGTQTDSTYSTNGELAFTTPIGTKQIRVALYNTSSGTIYFEKPMLNVGSTEKPFEEYKESLQFFDEKFYAGDYPYLNDKLWYKAQNKKEILLNGDLPWEFHSDYSGFKRVYVLLSELTSDNQVDNSQDVVKYDGSILSNVTSGSSIANADQTLMNSSSSSGFHISIADSDSGWQEGWSGQTFDSTTYGFSRDATPSDMISAYFNGWVYVQDPNGDGTKTDSHWKSMYDSSVTSEDVDEVITRNLHAENDKEGYKLVYELAETEHVDIDDKVIGECTLDEVSHVSYGVGMVYKERAKPQYFSGDEKYYINHDATTENLNESKLDYANEKILKVFKNGSEDYKWEIYTAGTSSYGQRARVSESDYDKGAVYEVTYLAEPYQLSTSLNSVDVTYNKSMKTQVDDNTQAVSKHETEIDDLRVTKANKEQMDYIEATLLSGWENFGSGYSNAGFFKDEFGMIQLTGMIKNGSQLSDVLNFPKGYRPKSTITVSVLSSSSGTLLMERIDIKPNGFLEIKNNGGTSWVSLDDIPPFRAEQ